MWDRWTRRRLLTTAGGVAATTLAGCSSFGPGGSAPGMDWPQPRFDVRRTGANPAAAGPAGGGERWSRVTGDRVSGAVVDGDRLAVGGTGIFSLTASSGDERWHRPSPFESRATPTLANGAVYASSRSILYALDAGNGDRRWTHSSDLRHFHAPVVTDGIVLVGTTVTRFSTAFEAELIAFGAATGAERWRATVGSHVLPPYAPASDGETVYVGRDRLTALERSSGVERWTASPEGVSAFTDPTVVEDRVYVAGVRPLDGVPGGVVLALDATSGDVVWRVETGLSPAALAVADGTVYVTADRVLALDAADGTVEWAVEDNRFLTAPPSLAGDRLYVAGIDGTVRALAAPDGRSIWERRLPGSVLSAPTVAGELLYVGSGEGRLYALGSPRTTP